MRILMLSEKLPQGSMNSDECNTEYFSGLYPCHGSARNVYAKASHDCRHALFSCSSSPDSRPLITIGRTYHLPRNTSRPDLPWTYPVVARDQKDWNDPRIVFAEMKLEDFNIWKSPQHRFAIMMRI